MLFNSDFKDQELLLCYGLLDKQSTGTLNSAPDRSRILNRPRSFPSRSEVLTSTNFSPSRSSFTEKSAFADTEQLVGGIIWIISRSGTVGYFIVEALSHLFVLFEISQLNYNKNDQSAKNNKDEEPTFERKARRMTKRKSKDESKEEIKSPQSACACEDSADTPIVKDSPKDTKTMGDIYKTQYSQIGQIQSISTPVNTEQKEVPQIEIKVKTISLKALDVANKERSTKAQHVTSTSTQDNVELNLVLWGELVCFISEHFV